ncbi:MAG: NADPH-dependent FMN reductase, partial [Crocinitomicaceae bacterium]
MITIISGTNRSNSNSLKVSVLCNNIVKATGAESQIFSLEDLNKDFLFSEMYQEQSSGFKNQVSQYIHKADKIIFIVPEYHGSYP